MEAHLAGTLITESVWHGNLRERFVSQEHVLGSSLLDGGLRKKTSWRCRDLAVNCNRVFGLVQILKEVGCSPG